MRDPASRKVTMINPDAAHNVRHVTGKQALARAAGGGGGGASGGVHEQTTGVHGFVHTHVCMNKYMHALRPTTPTRSLSLFPTLPFALFPTLPFVSMLPFVFTLPFVFSTPEKCIQMMQHPGPPCMMPLSLWW